ncbi:hypothetical protein ABE142_21955 [Paenibacillus alvei]|uniref:hypothetical protein n=1 Tax=Paenibacillus alvei TaxID=44250 RepID=UPI003D281D4B
MKKFVALTIAATLSLTGQVVQAAPQAAPASVDSTNLVEKQSPPPDTKYIEHVLLWSTGGYNYFEVSIREVETNREIAHQKVYPTDRFQTKFNINNSLLVEGNSYRINISAFNDRIKPPRPITRGNLTYKVNKLYTYKDGETAQINIDLKRVLW